MSAGIKRAEADRHLGEILRIERACFPDDPWSADLLKSKIEDPGLLFRVAAGERGLLGFAILQLIGPEAELQNIAVDPAHARRGVGRALLSQLIEAGRAGGAETFHLEVRASNAPAIALYQSLGFQAVGFRRDYYANPREHALRMVLSIPKAEKGRSAL